MPKSDYYSKYRGIKKLYSYIHGCNLLKKIIRLIKLLKNKKKRHFTRKIYVIITKKVASQCKDVYFCWRTRTVFVWSSNSEMIVIPLILISGGYWSWN